MTDKYTSRIDWLGHASFRIRGSRTIYIDPWKIQGTPRDGDIILVTHDHYDHLSNEDIIKVAKGDAVVVIPESSHHKLKWHNAATVQPGESKNVAGVTVESIPAYNTNKDFHPRSQNWVGYIIDLDGIRVYHCGDTDVIDEMNGLKCDVALLAISGTYVMTATEAVEAAKRINPGIAIPMHYGEIVGSEDDARIFADSAPCEVVIKEPVA